MKRKYLYVSLLTIISAPILSNCGLLLGAAAGGTAGYYVANDDRTVGQITDDASITAGINARYVNDKRVSALDINVDTRNGVVTLYGSVPSIQVENRAVEIARSVKGVKQVISKITITPAN